MLAIRYASLKDVPLIRSLAQQIWPQTYASIISQKQIDYMMEMMYSEDAIQQQMMNNIQFIISCNSGIPVGFAGFNEIEPSIYKLHKIYVLSSQQGKGTGRFMIDQIIDDIKSKGAIALRLNVNRNNTAKQFYEKIGFIEIASEDIDIGGGFFMNDYVMEKKLNAVDVILTNSKSEILNPES